MPYFSEMVDVDVYVSPREYVESCDSDDIKHLVEYLRHYGHNIHIGYYEMLKFTSDREFLKELAYFLKYENSENLEFLKDELLS